ncbi:MAG: hypothetical protein IPK81_04290 [Rhodospirillales bacterium]|nr:MAG: hypothetical protein IPK81_04290 [Rhodospirillales bacterium]
MDKRKSQGVPAADDRSARLADALRQNLRRRKAQARAKAEADHAPARPPPATAPSRRDGGGDG